MAKTPQPHDETFPVKLTLKERQFLFARLDGLEDATLARLESTPPKQSFQLTFDQLEDVAIHVTGLLHGLKDPAEREVNSAIFRKISGAMRVAAEAEAGADDDLRSVISIREERAERNTAAEAEKTQEFFDHLTAHADANGLNDAVVPTDLMPAMDLQTMADELPLPPELRARILAPGYQLTVADSMALCQAVAASLADDPGEDSAEFLRLMRDLPADDPLDEMLFEAPEAAAPRPRKSRRKRK